MNQIEQLTKDCQREDCSIVWHGATSTLMGWSQSYDKHGRPQGRDPNTTINHFRCSTCGQQWKIESREGVDLISAS